MSAEQFLSALAGDFRNWHDRYLWVCGFTCEPSPAAPWGGRPINGKGAMPDPRENGYFSVGVFNAQRRVKTNQIEAFVLVLDDIDTDGLNDLPLHPTYIVETSPGNHHVGFGITDRENVAGFAVLQERMTKDGIIKAKTDKSGNNANRYVRLPGHINNKPEIIAEHGEPFVTRLVELTPERRYTIAELAHYFGVSLDEAPKNTTTPNGGEREADAELMRQILTGDGYHDALLKLAARYAQHGNMGLGEAVGLLQGAMLANPDRSQRWQDRYNDIARAVASAWEKFRKPAPAPNSGAAGLGLKLVEVVDVLEAPPPAPAFWIDELVPAGVVTLLGAHGGTGKSMLALTAAVCLAAGLPFLGKPTRRAKVVFYSGEDPALVLRWRLSLVCKHLDVDPRELEGWLAVIDATEGEPTLFYECTLDGRRVGLNTEVYGELDRIAKAGAEVFIIDNASDTFDADEINRARVRAFIRSLAMLTKPHAGAVLLLAHIDKTSARGFGGKEGYSGSTAWHNSVRSRLFLSESGDGLMLEQQKANLGRKASPMQLDRLEGGVLSLATVGTNPAAGLIASAHRDVVLGMFAEFYDRGEFLPVSQQAPGNAHKALSAERGFPPRMTKAEFWQLVRDAERAGYLVRENYQTKDRKERTRWCVTDSGRKVSGISPPAPTAPTLRQVEVSAPGACGAPTAPTSQGGCGGKMARTSRRKVGAVAAPDALPEGVEAGEVGAPVEADA